MHVIGLLGGVACGKSLVAGHLARLGAEVLDGDRAGHEVLELPEVEQLVRARWGDEVLTPQGRVVRPALAARVFAETPAARADRAYLESITHPRIGQLLAQRLNDIVAKQPPAVVLDAPLMLEAGWDGLCDRLLFIEAPREVRLARARLRGWSEADFLAREAAQVPVAEKRRRAQVVIDNSGSESVTARQVEEFWRSLSGAS